MDSNDKKASVPVMKLPVPVVLAAAVVSSGAGPGALLSREPLLPTDPTQRRQGRGNSAGGMDHPAPTAEMTVNWALLVTTSTFVVCSGVSSLATKRERDQCNIYQVV